MHLLDMHRHLGICLLPWLWHCSLVYGDPPIGQCTTDADCQSGPSSDEAYCDVEHAVCVRGLPLAEQKLDESLVCSADADAATDCAGAGARCNTLRTRECPCLVGDFEDPDVLVIGTISPHTFRTGSGVPLEVPFVPRWLKTIDLGLEEWQSEVPGGRLRRVNRPLALLHCNSNDHLPQARRAMAHLVDVAQAPIVLTLTDNDTQAVRYQALGSGTTLLCSTCFAATPADPTDTSLVWQNSPPLIDQAPLAAWRVASLAAALRSERGIAMGSRLDVVTLSQQYAGIDEFVAQVEVMLEQQDSYRVTSVQTPDPRAQRVVQLDVARAVVAARPQLIVVGMDTDFTTYYLRMIESEWPSLAPRPHYILTHLNQEVGLFVDIVGGNDDLRQRISGTGWGPTAAVARNLSGLTQRFAARYSERLDNTQDGYDAFYAAAYALMLTDRSRALEGEELSHSLGLLALGALTNVGPAALQGSLAYFVANESLDLVGASNELDWHPTTHQTKSDVALWCLSRDDAGELALSADAGPRWQHASGQISGDYACP